MFNKQVGLIISSDSSLVITNNVSCHLKTMAAGSAQSLNRYITSGLLTVFSGAGATSQCKANDCVMLVCFAEPNRSCCPTNNNYHLGWRCLLCFC